MKTKGSEQPWAGVRGRAPAPWRQELHRDFERPLVEIKLPERPDHEVANHFLVMAQWEMAMPGPT